MGLARDILGRKEEFGEVKWVCEGLEKTLLLDNRLRFAEVCQGVGVSVPQGGCITSRRELERVREAWRWEEGVCLKRVESSTHRATEIVRVRRGEKVPEWIRPGDRDVWQWQKWCGGKEISCWYVVEDGRVLCEAAYWSLPDLVAMDPVKGGVPSKVGRSLEKLMGVLKLTGQFAFDVMLDIKREEELEEGSYRYWVIECNPRASSILETISDTPLWGECFFGVDVRKRIKYSSKGFLFHRNTFPFVWKREEAIWEWCDPLPFFVAQLIHPLWLIQQYGLNGYHHIDVNIGKIITGGLSVGRHLDVYQRIVEKEYLGRLKSAVRGVDRIVVDGDIKWCREICDVLCDKSNREKREVVVEIVNILEEEGKRDLGFVEKWKDLPNVEGFGPVRVYDDVPLKEVQEIFCSELYKGNDRTKES